MKKLNEKLWPIVLEYTRQVAEVMGYNEWHWVGTDDHGNGVCSVLDFGGGYFLDWSDVQVIVNRLDEWVARYGSKQAVGDEVRMWEDWWLDDLNDSLTYTAVFDEMFGDRNKRYKSTYPRINLEHWLMGCPRDAKTETDKVEELRMELAILKKLSEEYRGVRTIENVINNIEAKIKFFEEQE